MKIRTNIFETNSSSTHSLVLDNDSFYVPDLNFGEIKDKTLNFKVKGEFGWQWEVWSTAREKLSYLFLDQAYHNKDFQKRLASILKKKLNLRKINFIYSEKEYEAYIDHQSSGTAHKITKLSDDEIWTFLTSPNSVIRGGNDNEEGPWSKNYYDE